MAAAAEQQVVDWEPEDAHGEAPVVAKEWDGTRTRLRMARNVFRGGHDAEGRALKPVLVGRSETIEFEAAYDKAAHAWVGPEAHHVQELINIGAIEGTSRAAEVDADVRSVEVERGAWGGGENGAPLRPDLRSRSRDELYRLMIRAGGRAYVEGTLEERIRIDRQEARRREDPTDAIRELAAAIREGASNNSIAGFLNNLTDEQADQLAQALTRRSAQPMDNTGEWPGAQGPGTHPSARARRRQAEEPPPIEET